MKICDINKVKYTLSDLCIPNGIVRGPFGGSLKKEIFVKNGFKVYEQGNAIYRTVKKGNYYIDKNKYNELIRFSVKDGDFIISCSGTIGCIYRIPKDAPQGIINQALLKLTIDNSKIDTDLFYLYFSWDNFQKEIIDDTQGGAMKNLVSIDKFRKTIFSIPKDLKEQQKIATTLTHIDNLINDYEKLIKKKEAIKKGMMQELLTGKKRLKGYNEKWEKYKLEDIVNRLDNKRVPVKATLRKSGYTPYYGANGIQDYVDGYTHDGENILVAEDGANDLKNYPVFCVNGRIWVNNHAHVLKAKNDNYSNEFISLLLKGVDFENIIVGSSRAKLNSKALMQIELLIPKIKEQQAISAIILNHKNQIDNLNIKLNKLKSLKKSMMSNLLTGKIRL